MTFTRPPALGKISESEFVIRALYEITSDFQRGFEEQTRKILEVGCQRFGLDIGILAQVSGDDYAVAQTVRPKGIPLHRGDTFSLAGTYCSETLRADGPVGFEHIAESTLASHPAYRAFRLEAYIGTPVRVNGEKFGTLNFSSPRPRPRQFRDVDLDALQLMSHWIGAELHRRRIEAQRVRLIADLEKTIERLRTLEGLIPICASCKSIRDDRGSWTQIERYLSQHSEATFTHGI